MFNFRKWGKKGEKGESGLHLSDIAFYAEGRRGTRLRSAAGGTGGREVQERTGAQSYEV